MVKTPEKNMKSQDRSRGDSFDGPQGDSVHIDQENHLETAEIALQSDAKLAALEQAIKDSVIPTLYDRFGPGMIARNKRPTSLISPALKAYLNEPMPEKPLLTTDWFSEASDADDLMASLQRQDHDGTLAVLEAISARGASYLDISLGIVAEAARTMNAMWERDEISFVDVTLSTAMLKQALRTFVRKRTLNPTPQSALKTALITAIPGDQHNLGVQIIEDMLRLADWSVSSGCNESLRSLSVDIRKQWFTIIGISVSDSLLFERCKRAVSDIRAHSRNPDVIVMLGGRAVVEDRGACEFIGADVVALNAKHALSIAAKIDGILDWQSGNGDHVRLNHKWMSGSRDQKRQNFNSPKRLL